MGNNIKKIREDKGISQADLERITGIKASNISKYENDKKRMNEDTIRKLADGLQCSIDELLKNVKGE